MRVIIAGGRDITDMALVEEAIAASGFDITTVVSGCARGVDTLGLRYAHKHGLPEDRHPAEWEEHGKRAGILRNETMARTSDALIAVWDGKSRGTQHMIHIAHALHLKVYVHRIGD